MQQGDVVDLFLVDFGYSIEGKGEKDNPAAMHKILHVSPSLRQVRTVMRSKDSFFFDVAAFPVSNNTVRLFTLQAKCDDLKCYESGRFVYNMEEVSAYPCPHPYPHRYLIVACPI